MFALGTSAQMPAAPPARPNVIFIMTDDQGSWGVGAYGNTQVVTPNLDRLARDGALVRNAFVTTPVCSATGVAFELVRASGKRRAKSVTIPSFSR